MNVLLVEDDSDKIARIAEVIEGCIGKDHFELTTVGTVNDALVEMGRVRFDVVIADLVLPQMKGARETSDATPQWCEQIENHWSGKMSSWVVMTGFHEIAVDARESFARHGVAVIEYDETGVWKTILANRLRELAIDRPLDFLIVCALEKERASFKYCKAVEVGRLFTVQGLDCLELKLGEYRGVAVVLSAPGLVSTAIATTKAAQAFKPRAIAMSGICGGIQGEVELGDLVVPDVSWNYQAGKIVGGKLKPELMQVAIPPKLRARLQQIVCEDLSRSLRDDMMWPDLVGRQILMLPMVSGSQVVADPTVGQSIIDQSRKVAALDMEVAALYSAARDFFNGGGVFFAAKTVVDLANADKDDKLHQYGCALSSRFVVETLGSALDEIRSGEAPFLAD